MIKEVLGFVTDWPGEKQHARENINLLEEVCDDFVWLLNDPNDYFNAQWAKACEIFLFEADYPLSEVALFWQMGDVWPPTDLGRMMSEGRRILSRNDVGWFAPDVEWTGYIYDKSDLKALEPEVYEVPNTDSLCFMIRGDVVAAMPFVDPKISFMWGMDYIAVATARLMGLKAVRDYRFKAEHPNDTRYDIDRASQSMKPLFASLDKPTRDMVESLMIETSRLRKKAPQPVNSINPPQPLSEREKNQIESARRHRENR